MAAAISQQTIPVKDGSVRKRRRRAPAGGAADDCFACSKKNIKCDRRRPYCSQCLEVGSECSGYKTQLTWGVGVASRGKLRGLSLPIAKSPPVTREPKKSPSTRSRAGSGIGAPYTEPEGSRRGTRAPIDIPSISHTVASTPTTPYPIGGGYDYLAMSHPEHTPPMHQGSWASINYSPSLMHSPGEGPKYPKYALPLVTDRLSSSIESVSEVDYLSPLSQSFSREEMPYVHGHGLMYDSYHNGHTSPGSHSPPSSIILDHARSSAPTACPGLVYAPSEHRASITSHMDPLDSHLGHKLMRDCDNLSVPEVEGYSTSYNSTGPVWSQRHQDEDVRSSHSDFTPSHWPTMNEAQPLSISQELISKMPFFMDYYKNIMCPSMVYIDGPHNPFRDHVLQLAENSQSLQHAICALAACNLRMKRRLSLGHGTRELSDKLRAEASAAEASGDAQHDDPALSEEYQYRNLAVQLLNQQLNDPVKSTNDSALATILLLCHYRMVESGIAKFHTQFAGVRKILALRSQHFNSSRDSAWMEAVFTYFDAISASINDREGQLNPTFNSLISDAQLLPAGAENLVGCDRELFKTISKLGRLNLLSQHRPVQERPAFSGPARVPSRSVSPLSSLGHLSKDHAPRFGNSLDDMYQLPGLRFDGNGFGAMMDDEDMLASAAYSSVSYDEHRANFWNEWKEARVALQSWQFDATRVASSLPGSPNPSQVRDLGALSEAFRYAALLYTERLAKPDLPSSDAGFQNLVSQVVYYVTSLETGSSAEKFLLWPLFVAGSECINELQRNIVRAKCRDIMSRSGYMNNLAAMDVLEQLWAQDWEPRTPASRIGSRGGPFNWAKCIGGPGVEVEWIMF